MFTKFKCQTCIILLSFVIKCSAFFVASVTVSCLQSYDFMLIWYTGSVFGTTLYIGLYLVYSLLLYSVHIVAVNIMQCVTLLQTCSMSLYVVMLQRLYERTKQRRRHPTSTSKCTSKNGLSLPLNVMAEDEAATSRKTPR